MQLNNKIYYLEWTDKAFSNSDPNTDVNKKSLQRVLQGIWVRLMVGWEKSHVSRGVLLLCKHKQEACMTKKGRIHCHSAAWHIYSIHPLIISNCLIRVAVVYIRLIDGKSDKLNLLKDIAGRTQTNTIRHNRDWKTVPRTISVVISWGQAETQELSEPKFLPF